MSDAPSSNVFSGVPEDHYTDEQKKLVNGPLFSFLRQQAIDDMVAYAAEHGLLDDEEDEIPEAVYKKGRMRNIADFIKHCIRDALYNNPYKVVPTVYLICAGGLFMAIIVKIYVVFHEVGRRWALQKGKDKADLHEKIWDTMAGTIPIVVTLVLFLFPPLIANM